MCVLVLLLLLKIMINLMEYQLNRLSGPTMHMLFCYTEYHCYIHAYTTQRLCFSELF